MKKRLLSVLMAFSMVVTGFSGYPVMTVQAEEGGTGTLDPALYLRESNYMSDTQYRQLFGDALEEVDVPEFEENSTHPLEDYTPSILNELYFSQMNRNSHYEGTYAIYDNMSASSDKILNDENVIGKVENLYDKRENGDMYTQGYSVVSFVPGDLSDPDSYLEQQIIVENRIWNKEDHGFACVDDSYSSLFTYTPNGDSYKTYKCADFKLDDNNWAGSYEAPEIQGVTAITAGDFDGDNYNEVAVYIPASASGRYIYFYQPRYLEAEGCYTLEKETYSLDLAELGSRFAKRDDELRTIVHLNKTSLAGRDDLVISASMPYTDEFSCNSALAIYSFQNKNKSSLFLTELEYNDSYRMRLAATTAADLNGDGVDELVVGGFKNYSYTDEKKRGEISTSEYLMNVLTYKNGSYSMVWDEP